jgi:hypothetical protein
MAYGWHVFKYTERKTLSVSNKRKIDLYLSTLHNFADQIEDLYEFLPIAFSDLVWVIPSLHGKETLKGQFANRAFDAERRQKVKKFDYNRNW